MNRKSPWRRALWVVIGLMVLVLAIRMAIRFADAQISYSDEATDIVLVPPAAPPQPATAREVTVARNPAA